MSARCTFCGHPVDSPAYGRCTFAKCGMQIKFMHGDEFRQGPDGDVLVFRGGALIYNLGLPQAQHLSAFTAEAFISRKGKGEGGAQSRTPPSSPHRLRLA